MDGINDNYFKGKGAAKANTNEEKSPSSILWPGGRLRVLLVVACKL